MSATPIRALEPKPIAGGLSEQLLKGARFAVEDEEPIIAYALVALHAEGGSSISCRTLFDETPGPWNDLLFVGYVTECVREHLLTRPVAVLAAEGE